MIIEMIQKENDIKKLDHTQLKELAEEIRGFLLDKISCTGGHLASNLGVVELTMALHLTLDFPQDKLIWDVGHLIRINFLQEEKMVLTICVNMAA